MDRPPQGQSKEDVLPQSACSPPTAFDLSRRFHHSPGSPTTGSGLHVARVPRWHEIPRRGVEPLGNSPPTHRNSLSAPQVQPNNAFSNTTVTLSYIDRSHIHSAPDQIAPGVRPIDSQAVGLLHRSLPDSKVRRLVSSTVRDGGVCGGQAANWQVGEVASQSEHRRVYPEATPVERAKDGRGGVALFTQHAPGLNGKHEILAPGGVSRPQHGDSVAEGRNRFSGHREGGQGGGVLNGDVGHFWDLDREPILKNSNSGQGRGQRQGGGDASDRARRTSRKLYSSLNEDFMSPLDESLSLPDSSADEMGGPGTPPRALNSPSSDSPCPEEDPVDVDGVKSEEGDGCRFMVQFVEVSSSPEDSSSDDSDVIEVPVTNRVASQPAGLPQPFRKSLAPPEHLADRKQLTRAAMKTERTLPEERLNGDALGEGRGVGRTKQPPHSILASLRRKVVVNLTPLRSEVLGRTRSVAQCTPPENLAHLHAVLRGGGASDGDSECDSEAEAPPLTEAGLQDGDGGDLRSGRRKSRQSSSGSEDESFSKSRDDSTSSPGPSTPNGLEMGQPDGSLSQSCSQKAMGKAPKRTKKPLKSHAKRTKKSSKAAQKGSKQKKKRKRASQPSSFCPQEPEIKLKYATYREERRDVRAMAFAPYVHLEKKGLSRCTVINYLEDETGGLKKGRLRHGGPGMGADMVLGVVPSTSCLELGRLDAEGRRQTDQVCCLCGSSTNDVDLGDLHGPYRPRKGLQGPGAPVKPQGQRDGEACSDSDSSDDGSQEKCRRVREARGSAVTLGPSHGQDPKAASLCDEEGPHGPVPKTPEPVTDDSDQRSAPTVALDTGEFWLHEDCCVWCTGVFLVRGRLYGLEEAVRLAQGTVCSRCQEAGATLGCFFKGCPNKYHYKCALLSDCVLTEENFTMKCTKHKNKSLKGVSRAENR